MMYLLDCLLNFIRRVLDTIFARRITNSLLIFVKTNTGTVVPVGLDPKWEVRDVKEFVAPKLGMTPEEVCFLTHHLVIDIQIFYALCITYFFFYSRIMLFL